MTDLQLQDLIEKTKHNDSDASEMLIRYFTPKMKCIARMYVKNDADVDDVLQESFIRMIAKLERWREKPQVL